MTQADFGFAPEEDDRSAGQPSKSSNLLPCPRRTSAAVHTSAGHRDGCESEPEPARSPRRYPERFPEQVRRGRADSTLHRQRGPGQPDSREAPDKPLRCENSQGESRRISSHEHDSVTRLSQFQIGIPQTLSQVIAQLAPDGEMVRKAMTPGQVPVLLVARVGQKKKQVGGKKSQAVNDVEQEGLVKLQGWPVTNRGRNPGLHPAGSGKASKKSQSFTQSGLPGSRK